MFQQKSTVTESETTSEFIW